MEKTDRSVIGLVGGIGAVRDRDGGVRCHGEIREALRMGPMSPEWTLPSRLADNPLVWMLEVDGPMIDIRRAPAELQQLAYEEGLIPFIPAGRSGADA
jgi:hypothetical protein